MITARTKLWGLLCVFSLLAGCTRTPTTEYDKDVNFSGFRTYQMCLEDMVVDDPQHPSFDNPDNRVHVLKAMQREMDALGYKKEETDPDLLAGFRIIIKDTSVTIRSCSTGTVYPYWPECSFKTFRYTQGTLVLYLVDNRENKVIWQSMMTGTLDDVSNKMEKTIDRAVKEMFKKFPLKQN